VRGARSWRPCGARPVRAGPRRVVGRRRPRQHLEHLGRTAVHEELSPTDPRRTRSPFSLRAVAARAPLPVQGQPARRRRKGLGHDPGIARIVEMLERHISWGCRRGRRGAGWTAHFQYATHSCVIRIAPHRAVKRKLARPIRHELDRGHFSRFDRSGVHTQSPDSKAVDDILGTDPQTDALALLHHDALARPSPCGGLTRYQLDLLPRGTEAPHSDGREGRSESEEKPHGDDTCKIFQASSLRRCEQKS